MRMYKNPNPNWLMHEQGSKHKELAFVFSIVGLPFNDLYKLGILHRTQPHEQFSFIVKAVCFFASICKFGVSYNHMFTDSIVVIL